MLATTTEALQAVVPLLVMLMTYLDRTCVETAAKGAGDGRGSAAGGLSPAVAAETHAGLRAGLAWLTRRASNSIPCSCRRRNSLNPRMHLQGVCGSHRPGVQQPMCSAELRNTLPM